MTRLLAAFYGDDFTGSSENLAQFRRHGLRCRLYFSAERPDEIVAAADSLDVVGFAGAARALPPEEMEAELAPAFDVMQRLAPMVMQYKICSTFDSAPHVGSFGHVMAMARRRWPGCAIPVFAASPGFGRYTAFATHFTRVADDICRLDRNPSMASHPATPMDEADLRRHLAKQTSLPAGAIMLTDYAVADGGAARMRELLAEDGYIVMDGVTERDVEHVARLVAGVAAERPTFAVAAQGLAQGLGRIAGELLPGADRAPVPTTFPAVERLLVLSGSCATETRRQLDALEGAGWAMVPLPPDEAVESPGAATERVAGAVLTALAEGRDVAVATSRASADVSRRYTADRVARATGGVYAEVARQARARAGLSRVAFAGGDTSSYAMRRIGARALEIAVFDQDRHGHVCRLLADDPAVDGLEVILKGGQVAGDDFFLRARAGTG